MRTLGTCLSILALAATAATASAAPLVRCAQRIHFSGYEIGLNVKRVGCDRARDVVVRKLHRRSTGQWTAKLFMGEHFPYGYTLRAPGKRRIYVYDAGAG